jgi:hypothetical protein
MLRGIVAPRHVFMLDTIKGGADEVLSFAVQVC